MYIYVYMYGPPDIYTYTYIASLCMYIGTHRHIDPLEMGAEMQRSDWEIRPSSPGGSQHPSMEVLDPNYYIYDGSWNSILWYVGAWSQYGGVDPEYYICNGFWDPMPWYLGTWTPRGTALESPASPAAD